MTPIRTSRRTRTGVCLTLLFAAACSDGGTETPPTNPAQVGPSGGTVEAVDNRVTLEVPAGAVSSDIVISVTPIANPTADERVAENSVYEFGPDGTQFAQPVTLKLAYDDADLPAGTDKASLQVSKLVGGKWTKVENVRVDSVSHRVTGEIRSFSSYGVTADPCYPMALQVGGSMSGSISEASCLYPQASRHSDYYNFTVATAGAYTVAVSGGANQPLTGLFGVKDYDAEASTGTVWAYSDIGVPLHVALRPGRYQVFVSGEDEAAAGTYSMTSSTSAKIGNPPCTPEFVGLQPGTSNEATLTTSSCAITIEFADPPKYNGEHAYADYYLVKVEAGKTYTFTAEILTPGTNIALALFGGGEFLKLSAGGPEQATKQFQFTPSVTGWVYVEVSSSTISDEWNAPLGSYRVSVSNP